MKQIFTILLLSVLCTSAFAQHRYHVENLTDYSQVSATASNQHRIGLRETAPIPCTGSPKIPVVLVQFADKSFSCDTLFDETIEHSDANVHDFYERFCNGSDDPDEDYRYTIGSLGPVAHYFYNCSYGKFLPEFVVIGPVTLSQSWEYYGKDNSDNNKDVNINAFYTEALQKANELGIDWSQFDNNGEGTTDFVFFIFAGEGQNAYGTISDIKDLIEEYPDEYDLSLANLIWPKEVTSTTTVGGHRFGGYGCTNEIYSNSVDGIGTMCHELSHGLGLPDFYDTAGNSFGLDYYDLMDSGCYCQLGRAPSMYNAYEREFMGWSSIETIDITQPQTITIQPIENEGKAYKIVNPSNSSEYFFMENRQRLDYDYYYAYIASSQLKKYGENSGLIIYHLDYVKSRWTSNIVNSIASHQYFTLLPADDELISSSKGYTEEYFNSMVRDLYPGANNVTSIDSSRFVCWTGNTIPVNITRIQQNDDLSITIDINGGEQTDIVSVEEENDVTAQHSVFYDLSGRRVETPSKGVYIKDGKKYFVK